MKTLEKNDTGQGDDSIIACLLDYPYLNDTCEMIAIYLGKHQA